MAEFGYFTLPGGEPVAEFEGAYLTMDKQFVQVWKVDPNHQEGDVMVAAVHLDKGQYVKKLSD
jgi:hypothetical protein